MAVTLALLAALAMAAGSVLQQRGTLQTGAGEGNPRFLVQILHRPVWLAGALCQAVGWVLQAAALDRGPLVVVQAVCSLSLVFALPLGVWLTGQVVTAEVWLGAGSVTAGIVVLLSGGSPQGGSSAPDAAEWVAAGVVGAVVILAAAKRARTRLGARRALLFGSAAGVSFALQAAVTKVFVPVVGHGLAAIVSSWTVYALVACALAGFVLQQSALKTGVLAPAIASSNMITLLGSILIGVTIFGESLSAGGVHWVATTVGIVLAVVGIALLARARNPVSRTEQLR